MIPVVHDVAIRWTEQRAYLCIGRKIRIQEGSKKHKWKRRVDHLLVKNPTLDMFSSR
jgi:hypothetical protein